MDTKRKDNISKGVLLHYKNHPELKRYGSDNVMSRPEVRDKVSKNRKGKNMGELNPSKRPEVREKMSKKLKGRVFTSEWKENLRISSQCTNSKMGYPKSLILLERIAGRKKPTHCEICGLFGKDVNKNGICFDHDHKTGQFRGWICNNCNYALGLVRDNIDTLNEMVKYLKKHA